MEMDTKNEESTDEEPQNSNPKQPHMEPLKPNPDHKEVHDYDKNLTERNQKHTGKTNKSELEMTNQEDEKKDLEQNANEPEEQEDESHFQTPFFEKILETTLPLIRTKFLEFPNFRVSLRIEISAAVQDDVEAINAHLNLLPGPRELEYIIEEHNAEIKSKANTNTTKKHIIGPMN